MPISNNLDLLDGDLLYEGQVTRGSRWEMRTGFNADTEVLVFGRAVVFGTANDGDLLLPANGTAILAGISAAIDSIEKRENYSLNADGDMGFPIRNPATYLVDGVIGVKVWQAITQSSPVFYIHTPTGAQRKGQFRADAGSGSAVQIVNARFLRSAPAGAIVPLAINLA